MIYPKSSSLHFGRLVCRASEASTHATLGAGVVSTPITLSLSVKRNHNHPPAAQGLARVRRVGVLNGEGEHGAGAKGDAAVLRLRKGRLRALGGVRLRVISKGI